MLKIQSQMLPCLNKQLFGFDCLGCGIQRAIHYIFQGDFIAAFKIYPAIYTLIPLFIVIGINFFLKFRSLNKIINYLAVASILIIILSFIVKKFN